MFRIRVYCWVGQKPDHSPEKIRRTNRLLSYNQHQTTYIKNHRKLVIKIFWIIKFMINGHIDHKGRLLTLQIFIQWNFNLNLII